MAPATLPEGFVLSERYQIVSTLGKGGMGVVYKAYDRTLGETVAIKVLRTDVAETPAMARRFMAEIRLARSVTHKNVCRIHEYGQDQGLHFISMAYVEGVDLKQVLRERGPLPPDEAVDLAIAIADGLQAIHDEGIVHRDLKTPNLMVDSRRVVRVMDFGIAKQLTAEAATDVTGTGAIVGTPDYMSPEQIHGQKLDARSDLYALGIVVYELFTGSTPFRAETPMATMLRHIQEPPPLSGPVASRIPADIVPLIARALAKAPAERFQTAQEMAEQLRDVRRRWRDQPRARAADAPLGVPGSTPPTDAVRQPTTLSAPEAREGETVTRQAPTVDAIAAAGRPGGTLELVSGTQHIHNRKRSLVAAAAFSGLGLLAALGVTRWSRGPGPSVPPSSIASAAPFPSPLEVARAAPAREPAPPAPPGAARTDPPAVNPPASQRGPKETPPIAGRPLVNKALAEDVEALLEEAESAFAGRQYEAAVTFYDEALKKDSSSERAQVGKRLAAAALMRAAQARAGAFVSGQTKYSGPPAADGPAGFESSLGVATRRVDQEAAPPGKIVFEAEPKEVSAGEPFVIRAYVINEGAGPLPLAGASVTTTWNGRSATGPIALLARQIGPRRKALVFSVTDQWRAETRSWSLLLSLQTARGESYRNTIEWR